MHRGQCKFQRLRMKSNVVSVSKASEEPHNNSSMSLMGMIVQFVIKPKECFQSTCSYTCILKLQGFPHFGGVGTRTKGKNL